MKSQNIFSQVRADPADLVYCTSVIVACTDWRYRMMFNPSSTPLSNADQRQPTRSLIPTGIIPTGIIPTGIIQSVAELIELSYFKLPE
jgi:hypothetical protein